MPGAATLEIRPRTTGEVLDDAWRLALADAPALLALSALFLLPAGAALLLLWIEPRPAGLLARLVLPAVTALLLPATGLSSGACQELFRKRAEGKPVGLTSCLGAAVRRGLDHMVARALVLLAAMPGLLFLILAGLVIWRDAGVGFLLLLIPAALFCLGLAMGVNSSIHPVVAAGEGPVFSAFRISGQGAQRQAGKATAIAFGRLALWVFAFLNLHLAVHIGLDVADTLGGFDVALLGNVLSLLNPAYCIALSFVTLVLAAPVAEATNYLLHVDARTRYEGLDLWYRVRRLFPRSEWRQAGGLLLALGMSFVVSSTSRAEDERRLAVRAARQELGQITQEVQAAKPYPGGDRWLPRLRNIADALKRQGGSRPRRYHWFEKAVADFPRRGQERAVEILKDLDSRLALLEQTLRPLEEPTGEEAPAGRRSKEEINAFLPPEPTDQEGQDPKEREQQRREKSKEQVRRDDPQEDSPERAERQGVGIVVPQVAGLGTLGWLLLGGLALAIVVVAVVLWLQNRTPGRKKPQSVKGGPTDAALETALTQPDQGSVEQLWRQADDAARAGRFLEAVRALYLSVLSLLHRANLIRYQRTRTNGEYANQLRPRPELHGPFRNLTAIFEVKYYGERACQADDYSACRGIAENIQTNVRGP